MDAEREKNRPKVDRTLLLTPVAVKWLIMTTPNDNKMALFSRDFFFSYAFSELTEKKIGFETQCCWPMSVSEVMCEKFVCRLVLKTKAKTTV
jgi:hypothetical protein